MLCPLQSAELTDRNIGLPCTFAFTDVYLTCSQDCRIFLCAFDLSVLTQHTKVQTACHVFPLRSKTIQKKIKVMFPRHRKGRRARCVSAFTLKSKTVQKTPFFFYSSSAQNSVASATGLIADVHIGPGTLSGLEQSGNTHCSVAWNDQGTLSALLSGLGQSGNTQCPGKFSGYNKVP